MATYSTSKKLKNKYLSGSGNYIGIGLVGVKPKTLRVSAIFIHTKMQIALQVVR